MLHRARAMFLCALAAGASGCFEAVGCPSCLTTIHVSARDGGPVPDVTVTYEGLNPFVCEQLAEETSCSVRPYGHGTYDLLVEAPGYRSVALAVEVPDSESFADCSCTAEASVVLDPL